MRYHKAFGLILMILSFLASGQQQLVQEFYVKQQVGFIDIQSLEEIKPPAFSQYTRFDFNTDYFGYLHDDSLYAINKYSAEWIQPVPIPKTPCRLNIDGQTYFFKKGRLEEEVIIMDSLLNEVGTFPTNYDCPTQFEAGSALFYAKNPEGIGVFKKEGDDFRLLKSSIRAYYFTIINSGEIEGYAFYGGDTTYLYDKSFSLTHSVNQRFWTEGQVQVYTDQLGKSKEPALMTPNPGDRYGREYPKDRYEEVGVTDSVRTYKHRHSPLQLKINEDYIIKSHYDKIIVYKLIRYDSGVGHGNADSYWFYIDEERKLPLIPQRYIEEFQLEIVSN